MFDVKSLRFGVVLAFSVTGVALSACSTQGASRYGGEQVATPPVPCGSVMAACGHVVEYHRVQVQPPSYLVPAPCPTGQCSPPEPPVVIEPPVVEPPVIVEPPHEPPVVAPPPYEPPVVLPPPPPPPISCPEGTIPGYGGQDCIPITVPRK